MNIEEMIEKLRVKLSKKRFEHSIGVMETCKKLARIHDVNIDKAITAGLLHDCAKALDKHELVELCESNGIALDWIMKLQPELIHGHAGLVLARNDYGIMDEDILRAIKYHTTGNDNMTTLEKVVLLADFIEPGRSFPDVDVVREIADRDLDLAVLRSLDMTIGFVIKKGGLLHPATVEARNSILRGVYK